jgi:hypothetical protein
MFEKGTSIHAGYTMRFPVLFITGDQSKAPTGYAHPAVFVAYNMEAYMAFLRLNWPQVNSSRVFCVYGGNADNWPMVDRKEWGLGDLEFPIDVYRVFEHVLDDGARAVTESDEVWRNGCQVAMDLLAKVCQRFCERPQGHR